LPLLVIASIVMGLTLRRLYDSALSTLQQQHEREVELLGTALNNELETLAVIAEDTARFLSLQPTLNESAIYQLLTESVNRNPLVYGAAVAFEPFAYRNDLRLFAPYVFINDQKQLYQGALSGDYTDGHILWYLDVKTAGKAQWSEPYIDSAASSVGVVTYSVPLMRNGSFLGIASLDLRLDLLSRLLAARMNTDRFMLMSGQGRFVAHYDLSQIIHASLSELSTSTTNTEFQTLSQHIRPGASGAGVVRDLYLDGAIVPGNQWINYTPINTPQWSLATLASESEHIAPIREQIQIALLGLSLTIVLIFIMVWWISSRITRPIKKLEAAVSDVARGKLNTHIENIRSLDELGRLSIGFNRMLKNLKKQIELQSQQETAQKIVERELQMARETQSSLLPTVFPPFPDRKEFELHAVNQAAHHVAGDFFDFFFINPKTLVFVIADVSGKGMSAALVMAVTRTIVRDLAKTGSSPGEILRETNERLRESNRGGVFVTLFLGCYNTSTGKVIYANGGHLPPYLISKNGVIGTIGEATGTIVGMLEQQEYHTGEFTLKSGETLLLHTDGYPEARSPAGEFYGVPRIKGFLQRHAQANARELCELIINDLNQYQKGNLADDLTLLALKRSNTTSPASFLTELLGSK
jgi:phosphoserine phosphatase RsbU/P